MASVAMNVPVRPTYGEIWLVDLNPTQGHEQAGIRPAVVISTDLLNHGPADLVIVAPDDAHGPWRPLARTTAASRHISEGNERRPL
jgi:mRNA-degrading endonuclease toxin of MazEF toxin-antitoxin module